MVGFKSTIAEAISIFWLPSFSLPPFNQLHVSDFPFMGEHSWQASIQLTWVLSPDLVTWSLRPCGQVIAQSYNFCAVRTVDGLLLFIYESNDHTLATLSECYSLILFPYCRSLLFDRRPVSCKYQHHCSLHKHILFDVYACTVEKSFSVYL